MILLLPLKYVEDICLAFVCLLVGEIKLREFSLTLKTLFFYFFFNLMYEAFDF